MARFRTAIKREAYAEAKQVTKAERDADKWRIMKLEAEITRLRVALFMCAAHCQGGHSDAGAVAADELKVPFPITMDALAESGATRGSRPRWVVALVEENARDAPQYIRAGHGSRRHHRSP